MSLIQLLITSYLITILVEVPCGFLWKVRNLYDLALLVCVNTITNPIVVLFSYYLNTHMVIWQARQCLLLIELAVVAVEASLFHHLIKSIRHPWMYSLQANASSFAAGILFSMIFHGV